MARNEEKAMAALNRWTAQKRDLERANSLGKSTYMGGALLPSAEFGPYAAKKRPKIASEVDTVKECEHWRSEILRGVAKKIAEIQNAALGEHRIRDLNDEINKDLREKGHWEDRILALGGPDHKAKAPKETEMYGAELAAHSGYKYFGAAKDLPGVRELFEKQEVPEAPRKSRKQLFKNIQPDYYGWRDEDDDMLVLAEQEAEHRLIAEAVAVWNIADAKKEKSVEKKAKENEKPSQPEEAEKTAADKDKKRKRDEDAGSAPAPTEFKSYVDLPSMQEIQQLILQKKKQALISKYSSEEMKKQSAESNTLITKAS
mmetsp:Transcript_33098/g.60682  ORF Transcript_33098/g.60682 Transcript_33098/m.60682 type:complete len:315 (+) Transcript_33098:100-1044(+)